VFQVHARRTAQAAWALLGKQVGVLVSDRHGAYNDWADAMRQFCWAHLLRDFTAIAERGGDSERIGHALLEEAARMFDWWHQVRDGAIQRKTFQIYMRDVRRRVEALLTEGSTCLHIKTEKTCKKLLDHAESLWTFVRIPGVEPTNNAAERAVRHAVLWRRMSHGTHSPFGSRFVERILTTHATLRLQGRSVLAFLEQSCRAKLIQSPPPSLLSPAAPASAPVLVREAA
jgi:transposase